MQRKRRKKQENCPRTKPSDFELEGPFPFPFSTHPFLQTNIPLSFSLSLSKRTFSLFSYTRKSIHINNIIC